MDIINDLQLWNTVKPVLSDHSKIDITKIFMTNGSLMKAESIAECSPLEHSAILLTCIKQWSSWKTFLVFFLSGHLEQDLLYENYEDVLFLSVSNGLQYWTTMLQYGV